MTESSSSSSSSDDEDLFSYEGSQSLDGNIWDEVASGDEEDGEEDNLSSGEQEIDLELTLQTVNRTGKKRGRRKSVSEDDFSDDRKSKRRKRNRLNRTQQIREIKKQRMEEKRRIESLSNTNIVHTPNSRIVERDEDEDDDDIVFIESRSINLPLRRSSHSKSVESLRKIEQIKMEERMQDRKSKRELMEATKKKRTVRELKDEDILLDDDQDNCDVMRKQIIVLKIGEDEEEVVINVNLRRTVNYVKNSLIKVKGWNCQTNEVIVKRKGEVLLGTNTLNELQDLRNREVFHLSLPEGAKEKVEETYNLKFAFKGERHHLELQVNKEFTFKQIRKMVAEIKEVSERKIKMSFDDEKLDLKLVLGKSEVEDDDIIDCMIT